MSRLTISRHLRDLDAVVDHLRDEFNQDTVLLVGHSWGGALGIRYAHSQPTKVSHVVAVAPLIAPADSQRAAYEFVRSAATARGDGDVLSRLRDLGSPPLDNSDDLLVLESLTDRYGGVFHQRPRRIAVLMSGILRGLVRPWEIPRLIRANEITLAAMHDELLKLDLRQSVPTIEVPLLILLGRHDRHVDSRIAARYLETVRAPSKRLFWLEHSAHNVPFEEPERFTEIVTRVLLEGASVP